MSRSVYPENTNPVDLDEIDMRLVSNDSIPQAEIASAVLSNAFRSSGERDVYETRHLQSISLTALKHQYETRMLSRAMYNLLSVRTRIQLEDRDQFLQNDPHTVWNANADKRLDYICAMGNKLGLHAALTNRSTDIEYEFNLDIKPGLAFSGRYAQLGADQKEGLLRIGRRPSEDVFIFMCPTDKLEDPQASTCKPGYCTGDTRMNPKHSRILIAFIAHCLALMRDVTSVHCIQPYEINLPPLPMDWSFTNAL